VVGCMMEVLLGD
jgi:hypothetical protein